VATKQQRFAIISRFKKLLKENNIVHPEINLYSQQWAVDDLIESYGISKLYSLLEYYFFVSESPNWKYFINSVEKINAAKTLKEQDDTIRAKLRQQAREWLSK
jgi:hypothetical protein